MGKEQGWISLHRKIEHSKFWLSEKFTKGQAWIDILLLANHKENTIDVRGNLVTIPRGYLGWSEDRLAKRWKWSRGKVRRFFSVLQTEQQIVQQKSSVLSLVQVVNYNKYQASGTTDSTTNSTTDGHQTVQQTDTNNNVNNENNENNKPLVALNNPKKNDSDKYIYSKEVFERFWKAYKKDSGKKKTIEYWKKAKIDNTLAETIIEQATKYAKSKERKYRKDPERWIRDERWNDEITEQDKSQVKEQDYKNLSSTAFEKKYGSDVLHKMLLTH